MDNKRNERKSSVADQFPFERGAEKNLPKDQPEKELQEKEEGKYQEDAIYNMLFEFTLK